MTAKLANFFCETNSRVGIEPVIAGGGRAVLQHVKRRLTWMKFANRSLVGFGFGDVARTDRVV
jgi:hypothetical protein